MLMKKLFVLLILVPLLVLAACGSTGTTTITTPSAITTTTATTTVASTTTPPTPPATTAPTTTVPATTSTAAAAPASITTGSAAIITFTSAVLNGSVINTVVGSVDQLGFKWGTSSGQYDSSWLESGDFFSGQFNHLVSGLTEGVLYYFRSEMHTGSGWQYGEEQSFRTLEIPTISAVEPDYGLLGNTLDVMVDGSGFSGVTMVDFGDGITVNNFNASDYTQIKVNISIGANTTTGPRTVSVTTPIGTGTLAGGFTVKQIKLVPRTLTWKDADFNTLLHDLTTSAAAQYEIRFHDGNQMTLVTTQGYNMGLEILNSKLSFTNVPQQAWDLVFSTASAYMSYDSVNKVITINSLPDVVLSTLFNPPEKTTPDFNAEIAVETQITITYLSPGEV